MLQEDEAQEASGVATKSGAGQGGDSSGTSGSRSRRTRRSATSASGASSGSGSGSTAAGDSTASGSSASGTNGGTGGRSGTKSRSSRSRTKAASSAGTTTRARVGRSSRRKSEPKPNAPTVDISGDPVLEVADPETMTAPVADLQALDQQHLQKLAAAQRSRVIKAIVLAAIAVLFIVFVLQNARPVNVKLVFGTVTVRMIWVIVASGGLGALAGFLIARPDQNIHFHLPERRGKGKGTDDATTEA
jgi:uncharacterized integral membrane protein